jgi:hypothetical protein
MARTLAWALLIPIAASPTPTDLELSYYYKKGYRQLTPGTKTHVPAPQVVVSQEQLGKATETEDDLLPWIWVEKRPFTQTQRGSEETPDLPKRYWHLWSGSSDPSRSRITVQKEGSRLGPPTLLALSPKLSLEISSLPQISPLSTMV